MTPLLLTTPTIAAPDYGVWIPIRGARAPKSSVMIPPFYSFVQYLSQARIPTVRNKDWRTMSTHVEIATCLIALRRYAEAQPLLLPRIDDLARNQQVHVRLHPLLVLVGPVSVGFHSGFAVQLRMRGCPAFPWRLSRAGL